MITIGTHDMPPLKAFLEGKDIELREQLRLFTPEEAAEQYQIREQRIQGIKSKFIQWGYLEEPYNYTDFLEAILPLGVAAYVPFYGYANSVIWLFSLHSVMLVAFAVFLWQRAEGPLADVTALLGAAAFGFILSYFIQYKGFHYQVLPARIFSAWTADSFKRPATAGSRMP